MLFMNAKILWEKLRQRAAGNFEIHTTPQNKSVPLWFQVGKLGEYLIISKAQNHIPSVKLSNERKISYKDFEFVCQYYDRWLKGESGVRQEVSRKSQNTAYIFALISEATKVVI
jgi:hypothetical protein